MNFAKEVLHLDLKKAAEHGTPAQPILRINHLNVFHQEHHILKNINLNIPKGKITAKMVYPEDSLPNNGAM